MKDQNKKTEDQDDLARKIIGYARRTLATKYPDFLPALYLLSDTITEENLPLFTDGIHLFYNPARVIRTYAECKTDILKELMHIIGHGLLGHFEKRHGQNSDIFDATADLKNAAFLCAAAGDLFSYRKLPPDSRELLRLTANSTLEKLYMTPASSEEAKNLICFSQPLVSDSHTEWDKPESQSFQIPLPSAMWKAAAQQVMTNMQNSGQGFLAAMLGEAYGLAEESGISYEEFLKQFFGCCEMQKVDPDSIDPIWYRTGFSFMGDTTFVEPNEITEDAPEINIAIGLDTSGSCSGEVMNTFLSQLLAVVRDCGGSRYKIHLIQCDAEIQQVDVLSEEFSLEDLTENGYLQLCGWGGTDFNPVFDYVRDYNENGEGDPIKGLLYLSDGFGDFPREKPDYPVWFILPDEAEFYGTPQIPDWVTAAVVKEDYLEFRDDRR